MATRMNRIVIILIGLVIIGCNRENSTAKVFLTNHSLDNFDKAFFKVYVNDNLALSDTVKNHYLSFHWKDSIITVPKSNFKFRVVVNSNGYELAKDTMVSYRDSLKVFVTFSFSPYFKRYRNPEIYKYLPSETARLKEIADSLYANSVLTNASEYLNDTIPLPQNIEINIK
jgi:hypothetical protein